MGKYKVNTYGLFTRRYRHFDNLGMDKYERRRLNLMKLRDTQCDGKASLLAERINRAPSYVSRMLYPEGKDGKKRIADDMIELIEEAFQLPRGWLDGDNMTTSGGAKRTAAIYDASTEFGSAHGRHTSGEMVRIKQYDTGGSMGAGVVLKDQPGVIQGWVVSPEWAQKNIRSHTGLENLAIVTGFGDSMRGMFNPGDPLLVDTGVKIVDVDAVYFFRVGNEGFIKRLQRIPGEGIRVKSVNPEYDTWTIKPEMDFEVFGRVVKVWCGTDF